MEDRYLSEWESLSRLRSEIIQHGRLVVAFDVDNTIYDFHKQGDTFPLLVDIINKAHSQGHILIAFSAEEDLGKIKERLSVAGVNYDYINENPPFYKSTSRKIYYNILLDDRAGLWSAYIQLNTILNEN